MDKTQPILSGPISVQTKFAADEGIIEGYLARYGEVDAHGDIFMPGAFREALAEISESGLQLPLLYQHDQATPIGSWIELKETPEGVYGIARVNRDAARGPEALSLIRNGDVTGLSVGWLPAPGGRNGSIISKARLFEASVVSIPSASKARIKLKDFGSLAAFADALTSGAPLSRKDAEFVARKAWPAISGNPTPEPDPAMSELARAVRAARLELKSMKG